MVRLEVVFVRLGRRREAAVKPAKHIAQPAPARRAPQARKASVHLSKLRQRCRPTSDMVVAGPPPAPQVEVPRAPLPLYHVGAAGRAGSARELFVVRGTSAH